MTKRAYIELIQDRLANGDVPDDVKGKYHPRVVESYINAAYSTLMVSTYRQSMVSKDFAWLDVVASPLILAVTPKQGDDLAYVKLPSNLLQLPEAGQIRFIGYSKDPSFVFRLRTGDEATEIFSHLDVDKIDDSHYVFLEGDRMYFLSMPSGIEKIKVKAVKKFEGLDSLDEFSAPKGMEYEMMRILFDVIREKQMAPQELFNDRKPDH